MASPVKFQCSIPKFKLQINLDRIAPQNLSFPLLFRDQAKSTAVRFPADGASSPSNPKSSLLKTTCITLTAAAALFSASSSYLFSKPAAMPPVTVLEATLQKHLETQSNDVEALLSLAKIKFESDKYEQAIQIMNRLIEIDPYEQKWFVMKARILSYSWKSKLAIEAFEEILEKDPIRVDAYHYLLMEYYDSKPNLIGLENRVRYAMRRCKKKKEIRGFRMLIAQIKVIQGDSVEAFRICEELVKDDPEDFVIYLFQALVYLLLGKRDEATKQFEQVTRILPADHPYLDIATDGKEWWGAIIAYDNVLCYFFTFTRLLMVSLFGKLG